MSSIVTPRRRVWTRQPKGGRYTLTPLGFTSFVATGLTHHGNLVGGAKRSATRNGLALDTRTSAGDREVIPYNPGFALSGSSPFAITLMLSDANYWATGGMANAILGCADIDADGTWQIIVLPGDNVQFKYRRVGGNEVAVIWYITDLTGNKIITIVRESNVGYGVWRAVVNGIDYGTSTSGEYGSGEISVGQQSLHIGATALQSGRGLQGYVNLVHVARGKVPSLPEIISVHTNPWQIFAKRDRYAFVSLGGGSSVGLSIADGTHSHISDSLLLSWQDLLTVSDAVHAHVADNLGLSSTGSTSLSVNDATHAHIVDGITLTTRWLLSIADGAHSHTADNLTLDTSNTTWLTVQDSAHGHAADSVGLTLDTWLSIVDAAHTHSADTISLSSRQSLLIAEALHAVYSDSIRLGMPGLYVQAPDGSGYRRLVINTTRPKQRNTTRH